MWRDILYFLVPFATTNNLVDPAFIIASVIWSIIVWGMGLTVPIASDDLGVLSSVLTGTLGFLLPLYLSTCIDKNKSGITLYDAFCGDVIALAWEIAAYGDTPEEDKPDLCDGEADKKWQPVKAFLFDVLESMPDTIKHVFRGDFSYDKIDSVEVRERLQQIDDDLKTIELKGRVPDRQLKQKKEEIARCSTEGSNPIEATMFLLVIELRKIPVEKDRGNVLEIMMKKWNDVYSSYGTTSSLIQYEEPLLFSYVLYTAMVFYVIILPFSYTENSWNNIWLSGLVVYFFLSLNAAGKLLQNPFISLDSDKQIFQTVSSAAKTTRCIIRKIEYYGRRNECYKNIKL